MSSDLSSSPLGTPSSTELPALESGDRLTRDEFERRYEAMPHLKKAELIEGVVYLPSPVRFAKHGRPNRHLSTWLGVYESSTPGVEGADNASVRLDLDNEPQPDALLRIDPLRGGQSRTSDDDYVEGGPELVVEVAASKVSYALHDKQKAYRRSGIREYIVLRVLDREVDWFVLRGGVYQELHPDAAGILRSEVFPGLWLDARALIDGNLSQLLASLQKGLESPEHADFVKRLAKRR